MLARAKFLLAVGFAIRLSGYALPFRLAYAMDGEPGIVLIIATVLAIELTVLRLTDRLTGVKTWQDRRRAKGTTMDAKLAFARGQEIVRRERGL